MILTKCGVIGYPHMWIHGYRDTGIHVYAEMYGASERYGVSERSGALESSGASIEE